jgi:hypothetical protein
MGLAGLATVLAWCAPVQAQEAAPPQFEPLISPVSQVPSGMALARGQIAEGDLLGAIGSLERVLLAHPDASEARLLYASLLCRIDDPAGARVEVGLLGGRPLDEAGWNEVTTACGPIDRPTAQAGNDTSGRFAALQAEGSGQ